ncbi:MAG: hypothetical protein RBS13_06500 [Bacteroidales bacterium]|jgi:uncharacterized membrane protein|nr:hypothetical protein [Bacteroidales bacterium]
MPNRTVDEFPNWQKTAPYVRRFVLITGWLVYLAIPLLILRFSYPVNTAFAVIYGSLGTTVGVAVGFYFYRRGEQDNKVADTIRGSINEEIYRTHEEKGGASQ